MGFYNWGLFGMVGALTSVLLALWKSELVEVGNTDGMKELQRAFLGAALGFVAGILSYCIVAGGIIATGSAVPNLESVSNMDITLSVIWGFVSGLFFERIFERVSEVPSY